MSEETSPPVAATAAAKSGLSTLAKVGIGCGVLGVIGLVVFVVAGYFLVQKGQEMVQEATGVESLEELAESLQENPAKFAAELAIRNNPDLEFLETDDEDGTITFRNRASGEKATLNFEDIAEGRFSMSTDEGDISIDADADGGVTVAGPEGEARFGARANLEDVPDWVPLYPNASEIKSAFQSASGNEMNGALSITTSDTPQAVFDYYKQLFEEQEHNILSQSMTDTGQGSLGSLKVDLGTGREINIAILGLAGTCQVTLTYQAKVE